MDAFVCDGRFRHISASRVLDVDQCVFPFFFCLSCCPFEGSLPGERDKQKCALLHLFTLSGVFMAHYTVILLTTQRHLKKTFHTSFFNPVLQHHTWLTVENCTLRMCEISHHTCFKINIISWVGCRFPSSNKII